ncbi:type IX secretion system membrane protein PorP/SprF [Flavobacterium sp. LHD-80]|uniref:PorP/SprF family type IX secretion system membrane protein n=1 Tax=Flavobacterium sp. LHD-80 TaxID=3071411 RepID=UPI0027E18580|nr:type IX secretion system membrane protein PorP/SprF [Flavobacterium sp. LHD-80]MDQ6473082.1 type IX secretion system membrane protein PorP/SprF [Flavobacterium sp. LHD-80]
MEKRLFILVILISLNTSFVRGQQDSQFTNYMYNTMSFNPAYTGTRDALSVLALYRNQWMGIDGAPETINFSAQAPVGKKVGLGINVISDKIFVVNESVIDLMFSYKVDVSYRAKLSLGIKGGLNIFNVDFTQANTGPKDPNDLNLSITNEISPQVGVGAYYYTDTFYTGLSVPNIIETNHFNDSERNIKTERLHLYYIIGKVFELNSNLKFKPSGLLKIVSGSPIQVDVSTNFMVYDKLTLGLAYRWDAALSALAAFQVSDRWLIGYAYDWETTKLSNYNSGSHEFFLRFELINKSKSRLVTPRFF